MMIVDLQIAATLYFEIEEAVAREQFEHVIEKGNAGGDARLAASVEVEDDAHVRLLRLSSNFRPARLCL
jgi:hypothetical protein